MTAPELRPRGNDAWRKELGQGLVVTGFEGYRSAASQQTITAGPATTDVTGDRHA